MTLLIVLVSIYAAFLLWHHRWPSRPLTEADVAKALDGYPDSGATIEEKARFRAFFANDDGKPFLMLNLMSFRETAVYPDGAHSDVKSGRAAHRRYGRMVLKQLLKRGSYPIFIGKRVGRIIDAGPGTDFFEEVAIVRYRSRRDMVDMIVDPDYVAGLPHKWASLDKTVIAPMQKLVLPDLGVLVPLLLLAAWAVVRALAG